MAIISELEKQKNTLATMLDNTHSFTEAQIEKQRNLIKDMEK